MAISAAELRVLLQTDEALSLRFVVHREHGCLAIDVDRLTALVRHGLVAQATDGEVDRAVEALGGRREQPLSLDNLASRALTRLRGGTTPPAAAVYLLPRSVFPADAPAPASARPDHPPPR
jgi:hypothetical protein